MFFADVFVYVIWAIPATLMLLVFISSVFKRQVEKDLVRLNLQNLIFSVFAMFLCFLIDSFVSPHIGDLIISFDPALFQLVRVFYIVPAFLVASYVSNLLR